MVAPIKKDTILTNPSVVHAANAVVMVPPIDFKFNVETSADNEFQRSVSMSEDEVRAKAMLEFDNMVDVLRSHGVDVSVMKYPQQDGETPDAVFPNNWFSTTATGDVYLFPMACENRRREVRPHHLSESLRDSGYQIRSIKTLGDLESPSAFLESTGVMIKDHHNSTVYAALSVRCDKALLQEYADKAGFKDVIYFDTKMSSGSPVYHTNVMMAVGEAFAVICDEIIEEFERRRVLTNLQKTKEVITISEAQMGQFCGNILQLRNDKEERLIAMSLSAYNAFTPEQKRVLRRHGKLVPLDVSTIETIGGGSVRCMLGENFLPR